MKYRITAIAVIPFAFALATAAPVTAGEWEPQPTPQVEAWPDEGSGYPGYADQQTPVQPPAESIDQASALHATSVALGALGGIAIGGAALGITLVIQRRRDDLPSAQGA